MITEAPREQNWNQKNTVEHMKHFKIHIHLLFNNSKKYSSCDHYPKKYRFSKFKTQNNTPLIPVGKYAKSIPWGNKYCTKSLKFDLCHTDGH